MSAVGWVTSTLDADEGVRDVHHDDGVFVAFDNVRTTTIHQLPHHRHPDENRERFNCGRERK
ncbi:hypothetical protein [Alteromonas sp. ASW11-130]|uniref:hypothetical protein n=1 Tax=Alteromonas sp. ASW11-130 TaxID=3015775 RepID=UPI0022428693|nr:hypothetical protein [Alteromonas sp. ASW11-130]MCW8093232.1 hypothetical protein [Alteromonas sp. ASW11-130]